MGAALSDLSVLHQNNLVTLRQVLREKNDSEECSWHEILKSNFMHKRSVFKA